MINKSSAYSTVNCQNALNRTRSSWSQQSKHTCSPTSANRQTGTQKYAYKRPHTTLTREKHTTLTHWHVRVGGDGSYSLVPSSETIPSPSALFCLSNAFRSRTLSHMEMLLQSSQTACGVRRVQKDRQRVCKSTDLQVCIRDWMLRKKPTSFLSFR